ncbi:hypothetical protein ACES2L_05995 [Bdellovibrio bacteriovorus]
MSSGNPFQAVEDFVDDAVEGVKDTVTTVTEGVRDGIGATENLGREAVGVVDKSFREIENGLEDSEAAIRNGIDKTGREIGRGLGELTGKNAYERTMANAADRAKAESERLRIERENQLARSKEEDMQGEARRRAKADALSGRSGTILTAGFNSGSSTSLGAGGGKTILGA